MEKISEFYATILAAPAPIPTDDPFHVRSAPDTKIWIALMLPVDINIVDEMRSLPHIRFELDQVAGTNPDLGQSHREAHSSDWSRNYNSVMAKVTKPHLY
jgi:hypothetical protein